ncbi:trehalose-6-phosphate synthase [Streptomyces physcomitrii]|uniref:Trehalose-6-phosphate synthase n=1 Tax=Streptomyces physcomitrii TaxID=2724184 RepID=A0ABX1H6X5_9ACTN|nr:trehalose-6-phosphate synthase [Streptomyces physcomitrii]NKI44113.1 trehalose-6-phosphate synthase [Streptomyces physcomitrii]
MARQSPAVLVATKPAPVVHERVDERVVPRLSVSTGSVVGDMASRLRTTVVASAASEEDRALAERSPDGVTVRAAGGQEIRVRLVRHAPETLSTEHYGLTTEVLWHTMHNLWDRWSAPSFDRASRRAWESLHALNEDITEALLAQSPGAGAGYLIHDYQLGMVPARLRRADPTARVLFFHHIAWPGPEGLTLLPRQFADDLLRGMLGADVVCFFARRWCRNFLRCVEDLVPGARVDHEAGTVRLDGREVRVAAEPLSYSPDALKGLPRSWPEELDAWVGERPLVVHSGRTDPIKNAHRAVAAFRIAAEHPAAADARLLLRINPHRLHIGANAAYLRMTEEAVDAANRHFGEERIRLLTGNDRGLTFGALARADAVVLNSTADGQNLTAFEAIAMGAREPVLVVSHTCGAGEVLGDGALRVHPHDLVDQADALVEALTMTPSRRTAASRVLHEAAARFALPHWTARQLGLLGIDLPESAAAAVPAAGRAHDA